MGGGTRNEVFEEYFDLMIPKLSKKYPNKKLLIILDNLAAHKCSLILKIMSNYKHVRILFVPSCTPQFSPIGSLLLKILFFKENMFGYTKQILKQYIFESNEETV